MLERLFLNLDYPSGAPFKLGASCALALTALLSSCADPSARNEPLPAAPLLTIEITVADALSWSYQQDIRADLDGDGDAERVVLASDVQLSEKRRPLWEDGHRWALVIDDGGAKTLAYAAFVPRGFVEAAILQPASSRQREILLQERTPEQLRSIAIGYDGRGAPKAVSAAYY